MLSVNVTTEAFESVLEIIMPGLETIVIVCNLATAAIVGLRTQVLSSPTQCVLTH